jgi:dephospho-CoA kinase
MKLIIIHGPPAAGKLTVSNAIAEKTGFKVFHNHQSIDCIRSVIEFGTEAFWRLSVQIRSLVIAEAARQGGLVRIPLIAGSHGGVRCCGRIRAG